MSRLSEFIIQITGCNEQDTLTIENIMRESIFHSTLDWQTESKLAEAAKKACQFLEFEKIIDSVTDEVLSEIKQGCKFQNVDNEITKRIKDMRELEKPQVK
jgi:hypothetical protein